MDNLKIKVCGMKNPDNITALAKLSIEYMGLIFYAKSPRYIADLNPEALNVLPKNIERVGVFVNEEIENVIEQISKYKLTFIQLHGDESVTFCKQIKEKRPNIFIIKAFNISEVLDFQKTEEYKEICSYFLFDTKTAQHGGSGKKFDWSLLDSYQGELPFFLSGGISIDEVTEIKKLSHPKLFALDLNSRFEIEPGIKDIELVEQFIKRMNL